MKTMDKAGLGSLGGIRWLLAVGALVMTVSVYRLVESQWAGMSVSTQFLTLALGTLTVFVMAEIVRNRLRLPIAGSALSLLFAVLVPVLSWGAAYLDLLRAPAGVAVFAVSMGGLLLAFHATLAGALGYKEAGYPFAFSTLTLSLPLLSHQSGRVAGTGFYLFYSLLLGAVFYYGSRHINRFFFHRDRRDGIERPVHSLPFVGLGLLYVAGLSLIRLPTSLLAVPIAVVGATLVATGEEYYRALVRALRTRPDAWPGRSVALLALGFGLLAVAAPLSFLDGSGRSPAFVFSLASLLILRWGHRYGKPIAHVTGLFAAVVGFQCLPSLSPRVVVDAVAAFLHGLGLTDVVAMTAFAHLFLALLFVGLFRVTPDRLRRAHAIFTAGHLAVVLSLAMTRLAAIQVVGPFALLLSVAAVVAAKRREFLLTAQAAFGLSTLAWVGDGLGASAGFRALALALLALVPLGRSLERHVAADWKPYQLLPTVLWAGVIALSGLVRLAGGGAFELLLAGLLLLASGHRLRASSILTAGLAATSLGLHGLLFFDLDASRIVLVATNLLVITVSYLLGRRTDDEDPWRIPALFMLVVHGAVGVVWTLFAIWNGAVSIEPFLLLLFGAGVLEAGLREKSGPGAAAGLAMLFTYVPFHLWALGWIDSTASALLVMLVCLIVAKPIAAKTPLLAPTVERFLEYWRLAGVILALVSVGVETLVLVACAVVLGAVSKRSVPYASSLLLSMHLLVWVAGSTQGSFAEALISAWITAFPIAALFLFVWLFLVDRTGGDAPRPWTIPFELALVLGFLIGCSIVGAFVNWEYLVLSGVALAGALRHGTASYARARLDRAWMMQVWVSLLVLTGYGAGWVHFGHGRAPYILLAGAVAQYALGELFARHRKAQSLARSSMATAQLLGFVGGAIAFVRVFSGVNSTGPALQILPSFAASLFFLLVASRVSERIVPAVLSSGFLGAGLLSVAWTSGVGSEFYSLAPGFSLVAMAFLLEGEMGPRWSRHVFTAGASFIYFTPVLALYDEITWTWQAVLLVLTLGFGAASFHLRSRPLLTVSTAALVVDLACFVVKVRATEPLVLWVCGLLLGVCLMGYAAYLEYRHEGLAQQLRLFGRELSHWY